MSDDTTFARLVGLACHDLRTPLAAVGGFARTIPRLAELHDPADRYLRMIEQASEQMAETLDHLAVVARIESGRYDPPLQEVDSLELAREAAELVERGEIAVAGTGVNVTVDREPAERAVAALASCALRHGRLDQCELEVDGAALSLRPIKTLVAPIIVGDEMRDFGALAAGRLLAALGATVSLEEETLVVRFATSGGATADGP